MLSGFYSCRRYVFSHSGHRRYPSLRWRTRSCSTLTSSDTLAAEPETGRDLFEYTSGRWLWNEARRLRERHRLFNVLELKRLAAQSVSRHLDDVIGVKKIGEGASNRALAVEMRDGFRVIARMPYPVTTPRGLVVASEAATMVYLRSKGFPIPEIYRYCTTADNPVGSEYIIMEEAPGRQLSSLWHDMAVEDFRRLLLSLHDIEMRLNDLSLPANGSLFFRRDLPPGVNGVPVDPQDSARPESLYVGPSTNPNFWIGRRGSLVVNRGPFRKDTDVMTAGAEKEMQYLTQFGRPLLPFDRILREHYNLEKQMPSTHCNSLAQYIDVVKHLVPDEDSGLAHPALRHPDLLTSNTFVSDDFGVASLIDWQHTTVLPLYLNCSIPKCIDNSKDPVSRELESFKLPDNLRMIEMGIPAQFVALIHPMARLARSIYKLSSVTWMGENIALRAALAVIKRSWPDITPDPAMACPITLTEEEQREILDLDERGRASESRFEEFMAGLGISREGWVDHDRYEEAQAVCTQFRAHALEGCETDEERNVFENHWPFDDMDEDEYE